MVPSDSSLLSAALFSGFLETEGQDGSGFLLILASFLPSEVEACIYFKRFLLGLTTQTSISDLCDIVIATPT